MHASEIPDPDAPAHDAPAHDAPAHARSRRLRVAIALSLWAVVAIAAWTSLAAHEDGVAGGLAEVLRGVDGHPAAPIALLVAFLVRPITLLPVTVLTAFSGFLLGPVVGFAVAMVAVVGTSLLPYTVARLARGGGHEAASGWRVGLERHPFVSVLTARLAMLPGDLVNVAAGALRVPVRAFVAATALGGAPGMAVGVLAGASVHGTFRVEGVRVDGALVLTSAAILVGSLLVSVYLRRIAAPPKSREGKSQAR